MSRYSENTINRIREIARLEDFVPEQVQLHRRGADLIGCCPFHNENTPSFHIYQDQHYHCFGCGAHGDIFSYLMETEGLSFPDAVEKLASQYHIPLDSDSTSDTHREWLSEEEYQANRFEKALTESNEAMSARQYLLERGVTSETQTTFHLGYAHGGAIEFKNGKRQPSPFRNRLIIPLFNRSGKVIGLAGRTLTKTPNVPKYINSAESESFKKGNLLYGLNLLQRAAKDNQRILLVEGYFDVIMLYQFGFRNAVAGMGTALTETQASLLASLNMPVTILYDGDKAGQKATERAIPILLKAGILPKIIVLSTEHDPDSYIRQYGLLPKEENFLDYLLRNAPDPIYAPDEAIQFIHRLLTLLDVIPDPIARQIYQRALEVRFHISLNK